MKKRNFDTWLNSMKNSISDYSYYTDFNKVDMNVNSMLDGLNYLNTLAGMKSDIENKFIDIVNEHNEVIKCLPILLATRQKMIITIKDTIDFSNFNQPIEDYVSFMNKSGLFDMLSNLDKNGLIPYVRGVEVGLDSHARKNRAGHLMENIVEHFIREAGFKYNVDYFKEISSKKILKKFNIDSSELFATDANKRFDFVVEGKSKKIYLIETNFYGSKCGSKASEIARDYSRAFDIASLNNGFDFIWIADGKCWNECKKDIKSVFDKTDCVFNINDMSNGKLKKKLK